MKLLKLILLVLPWFVTGCAQQDAFYKVYCTNQYDQPVNCETGQIITIVVEEVQ